MLARRKFVCHVQLPKRIDTAYKQGTNKPYNALSTKTKVLTPTVYNFSVK